ncbi:MAG: AsmA family protein [Alphaproteobacteria bacterium]|nr:AsmA family protein [Alphaproteobacteria bacterium]
MKTRAISIIKILIAITAVILLVIYTAVYFIDISKYKQTIEAKAKEALNRNVTIGEISLAPGLTPTIVIKNARIRNVDGITSPQNMLEIGHLKVSLKILPLLKGNVEIASIDLSSSNIFLEKNENGKVNWDFAKYEHTQEFSSKETDGELRSNSSSYNPLNFFIGDVTIKDTKITYKEDSKSHLVDINHLVIEADSKSDPITIRTTGNYNETPFDVRGRFLSAGNLLNPDSYQHSNKEMPINIHIKFAKSYISAKGNVKNIHKMSGISLSIISQGKELSNTIKTFADIGDHKIGAYNLSSHISGDLKELALSNMDFNIGDANHFQLKIAGDIKNLLDEQDKGLTAKMSIKARSLSKIIKGTTGFPYTKIKANISDNSNVYKITEIQGKSGKSDIKGDISINLSGSRPFINANLTSKNLDLSEMKKAMHGDKPYSPLGKKRSKTSTDSAVNANSNEKNAEDVNLFSKTPFNIAVMKTVDAKIDVSITTLLSPQRLVIKDIKQNLLLRNGALAYNLQNASLGKGYINLEFTATPAHNILDTSLILKTNNVSAGTIISAMQKQKDLVRKGHTNSYIKLYSKGSSMHSLASKTKGQILIKMDEARIPNKLIKTFGGDTLTNITSLLSFKSDKSKKGTRSYTSLRCAVVNLSIRNGIAKSNKGIAFESDVMNAVADGIIDLGKEELDLKIAPYPQEGIRISLASIVGKLLKLQGPITKPSVKISKSGVAKSAVSIGAAVATGGLSLLGEKLVGTVTEDPTPCATALGVKK